MEKLKNKLKEILISHIDSSLYNLHGYELNVKKVKKYLPKSFNNKTLCFCPIYAWTKKKSAYFAEDKESPITPIVKPEPVEKKFNTFIVMLNYDTSVVNYIKNFFSIWGLLKLYTFLLKNRIKQWANKNLATLASIVAMIASVISIFLGIKNLNTSQEISIKVQIEQIPQSQSELITPKNSTVVVPIKIL